MKFSASLLGHTFLWAYQGPGYGKKAFGHTAFLHDFTGHNEKGNGHKRENVQRCDHSHDYVLKGQQIAYKHAHNNGKADSDPNGYT